MIAVLDRRDAWVGPSFLTRRDYDASPGWMGHFHRERNGAPLRMQAGVRSKAIYAADIVTEAIYRQLLADRAAHRQSTLTMLTNAVTLPFALIVM
jgi:hypothetical protein